MERMGGADGEWWGAKPGGAADLGRLDRALVGPAWSDERQSRLTMWGRAGRPGEVGGGRSPARRPRPTPVGGLGSR